MRAVASTDTKYRRRKKYKRQNTNGCVGAMVSLWSNQSGGQGCGLILSQLATQPQSEALTRSVRVSMAPLSDPHQPQFSSSAFLSVKLLNGTRNQFRCSSPALGKLGVGKLGLRQLGTDFLGRTVGPWGATVRG